MNCSTPGFPVHHQFPEFTQTHVHWVGDAIQPSPPYFGLRSNNREGTEPCPSTENWINDLLSMVPPIRTRPSFPLSPCLPLGSFHKPLTLLHQSRQTVNYKHRKLTNLITWTRALSNSRKLWAMPFRATQDEQVIVESSDKTWSTGEGNGKLLQYSCLENPMNSMKRQKDRTLKDELPQVSRCPICYWRSVEK